MRVYIAYSRDLRAEAEVAKEVIEELGMHTPEWERSMIGISQGAIYEGSRRNLEQADLFVGLVGNNYGWVPDKDHYGEGTFDGETSFFHSELTWAEQRGLPMLIFFAPNAYAEDTQLPGNEFLETEAERIQKVRDLRRQMTTRYLCPHFDNSGQLRELLGMSLMRLMYMQRYGDGTNRNLVFISHSTQDDAFVDQLSQSLYQTGLYPWVDHQHIPSGARWDAVLEHALNAADSLVLVVTPEAKRSTVVESEWTYIGEMGKKIYPVLLRGDSIPFRLRVLQFTDFRENYEEAAAQLLEALSAPGASQALTNQQAEAAQSAASAQPPEPEE